MSTKAKPKKRRPRHYAASRVPFAYPWYPVSDEDRNRYCSRPSKMSSKSAVQSQHSQQSKATPNPKEESTETVEYEVPDGGYGWVVVACAFFFIALPMGISASFSIYFEEWMSHFDSAGKVRISLIGSVGSGCVPLLGALGGMILTNLFNDIRLVGIIGCLVAATGFSVSYFVNDVGVLALTYGALGGSGMGLMFNCAYLSVGYYFDKNRPLATALASSGTGFGTLISRVIRLMINTYGWRGGMFILAAICMQCVVCGVLIRPLYAKKIQKKPAMSAVEEVIPKNNTVEDQKKIEENAKRNQFSSHDGIFRSRKLSIHQRNLFASHMTISHVTGSSANSAIHYNPGDVKLNPYNREDVFFGGSTYEIAEMEGKVRGRSTAQKHGPIEGKRSGAFTSQITIDDLPIHKSKCDKIKDNLKKSFDLGIFKIPTFGLVVLAMTLHHFAFFIPYTYILSLTREKDIPKASAEYLIICFGLSNFVNKLWIGPVMSLLKVEQLYVVITTLLLGSAAATIATFCQEFWQFVLAAILYGGTSPIVTVYVTNILVRYLGIANLTNAFSIVTMLRGIGTLSGPPFAAYIIERTGLTSSAFYVGSTADVLSASVFALILFINRQKPNRDDKLHKSECAVEGGNSKEMDSLAPKVIVTVPTAEGNLDKLIHYSNDCFDKCAARDQQDHAKKMRQRLHEQTDHNP